MRRKFFFLLAFLLLLCGYFTYKKFDLCSICNKRCQKISECSGLKGRFWFNDYDGICFNNPEIVPVSKGIVKEWTEVIYYTKNGKKEFIKEYEKSFGNSENILEVKEVTCINGKCKERVYQNIPKDCYGNLPDKEDKTLKIRKDTIASKYLTIHL